MKQLLIDPIATDYFGTNAVARFRLSDGNGLSVKYLNSTGQVVSVEKDWTSGSAGDATDFDGFQFGKTTLGEVRGRFGSKGMRFKNRPSASAMPDGRLALFNSYETDSRAVIATFVTTISREKIEGLRKIGGLRFGDVDALTDDFDSQSRIFDFREVRLADFQIGSSFQYLYDFGDGWQHTVSIEAFLFEDAKPKFGRCLDGARARPPEDVGGTSGYERFIEIIADASDPEFNETLQWCGGNFDPEWFDLVVVNKDIRAALRKNVRRQLHQPKPKK